jgi:hypothetical protein
VGQEPEVGLVDPRVLGDALAAHAAHPVEDDALELGARHRPNRRWYTADQSVRRFLISYQHEVQGRLYRYFSAQESAASSHVSSKLVATSLPFRWVIEGVSAVS